CRRRCLRASARPRSSSVPFPEFHFLFGRQRAMSITVILPENSCSAVLRRQLEAALEDIPHTFTGDVEDLPSGRLLFAVALDSCGCNEGYYRILGRLRGNG